MLNQTVFLSITNNHWFTLDFIDIDFFFFSHPRSQLEKNYWFCNSLAFLLVFITPWKHELLWCFKISKTNKRGTKKYDNRWRLNSFWLFPFLFLFHAHAVYKWMVAKEVNVKSVSLFSLQHIRQLCPHLCCSFFCTVCQSKVSHTLINGFLEMSSCMQNDGNGEGIKQHIIFSERNAEDNTLYHHTAWVQVPLAVDHHLLTNIQCH